MRIVSLMLFVLAFVAGCDSGGEGSIEVTTTMPEPVTTTPEVQAIDLRTDLTALGFEPGEPRTEYGSDTRKPVTFQTWARGDLVIFIRGDEVEGFVVNSISRRGPVGEWYQMWCHPTPQTKDLPEAVIDDFEEQYAAIKANDLSEKEEIDSFGAFRIATPATLMVCYATK